MQPKNRWNEPTRKKKNDISCFQTQNEMKLQNTPNAQDLSFFYGSKPSGNRFK